MYESPYPQSIQDLVLNFRTLPGIGQRSAERLAFHFLEQPYEEMRRFCQLLEQTRENITSCPTCGCLFDQTKSCWSCRLSNGHGVCIVAHAKDAFIIHSTHSFEGYFHVLGGLLDPIREIQPDETRLKNLEKRLLELSLKEVLIATDATLEGDATAHYIKQRLENFSKENSLPLSIYRLAFGMPVNSALEHVDNASLAKAIAAKSFW